jgi:hypothetical protein
MMANIYNLPLDLWLCILEHLSLDDLVCISNAFDSTSAVFILTKRHAVRVISALITTGALRVNLVLAGNGACYKFTKNHPRAGPFRHRQDHPQNRPCGGSYNPGPFGTLELTRTFHQNPDDERKTEMIIHDRNGKLFDRRFRRRIPPSLVDGPVEMVHIFFNFSPDSLDVGSSPVLQLDCNTLSEDLDDTFTDTTHSPFHVTRTVSHNIHFKHACWIESERKTALPFDWFSFLGSVLSARSTFSQTLVDPNSTNPEDGMQWKMLTLETKWSLLATPSIE